MKTNGQHQSRGASRSRWQSIAQTAAFDIIGPLATYLLLRSAGQSAVTALVLAGILPAAGVAIGIIRHRSVDAIGVLVLLGIVAQTTLGLVTGNAQLMLLEGSVPTVLIGLGCLVSLLLSRPLLYRMALQTLGPDTDKGAKLQASWSLPGVRQAFVAVTAVWGVVLLSEAAVRTVIVETTSVGTSLTVLKVVPYLIIAVLVSWTSRYIRAAIARGAAVAAGMQAPLSAPEMVGAAH
jgi:intracellular septation protein A